MSSTNNPASLKNIFNDASAAYQPPRPALRAGVCDFQPASTFEPDPFSHRTSLPPSLPALDANARIRHGVTKSNASLPEFQPARTLQPDPFRHGASSLPRTREAGATWVDALFGLIHPRDDEDVVVSDTSSLQGTNERVHLGPLPASASPEAGNGAPRTCAACGFVEIF